MCLNHLRQQVNKLILLRFEILETTDKRYGKVSTVRFILNLNEEYCSEFHGEQGEVRADSLSALTSPSREEMNWKLGQKKQNNPPPHKTRTRDWPNLEAVRTTLVN